MSSILTTKDIQAFASMINTSNPEKKNSYSVPGTIILINDPIALVTEGSTPQYEYTAKVQLDGGTEYQDTTAEQEIIDDPTASEDAKKMAEASKENKEASNATICVANYNGIICSVGDRVVVTISDGTATITENYTNPNGNNVTSGTHTSSEFVFTALPYGDALHGEIEEQISVPDGYAITGIKSIKLIYKVMIGGKVVWRDITDSLYSFIHLSNFSINGNIIKINYGAMGDSQISTFTFKAIFSYILIQSSSYSEIEEENNG